MAKVVEDIPVYGYTHHSCPSAELLRTTCCNIILVPVHLLSAFRVIFLAANVISTYGESHKTRGISKPATSVLSGDEHFATTSPRSQYAVHLSHHGRDGSGWIFSSPTFQSLGGC